MSDSTPHTDPFDRGGQVTHQHEPHSSQRAINGLRAGINGFVPHPNAKMMHEELDSLEEQLEALRWHAQYVTDMHPEGETEVDHKSMRKLRNTLTSNPARES